MVLKYFLLTSFVIFLSACSSVPSVKDHTAHRNSDVASLDRYTLDLNNNGDIQRSIENGLTRTQVLIRGGIKYLSDGNYEKANEIFNTALTFDIENGVLHFLNGYTYHQQYLLGDSKALNLAELGYKVAFQKEPSLAGVAYHQLGILFLDAKQYAPAGDYLNRAIKEGQTSPEVLYEFLRVSALSGNAKNTQYAIDALDSRHWDSPLLVRAKVIRAASQSDAELTEGLLKEYSKRAISPEDLNYLSFRIAQIEDRIKSKQILAQSEDPSPAAISDPLPSNSDAVSSTSSDVANTSGDAQNAQGTAEPVTSDVGSVPTFTSGPNAASSGAQNAQEVGGVITSESIPSDLGGQKEKDPASIQTKPKAIGKWHRCDTETQINTQSFQTSNYSSDDPSSTDENTLAPILPQPCPGESPRTAVIEVTMINSIELESQSAGINILDGLNAILTVEGGRTTSGSTTTTSSERSWVLANGASTTNLTYSLNIANAGTNRTRFLARPTMTVIDRVPSVFFSGAQITLSVGTASAYSTPTAVDKSVGVSLAVTATFVDDDSVLVSLRATSAGIATTGIQVTDALLQQTRNSMRASAAMKFGQTLILSGLRSNNERSVSSGVPLLQDLPLIQYLFKSNTTTLGTGNFIALLTLRRTSADDSNSRLGDSSELETTLNRYTGFEEKDFLPITESSTERIKRVLQDLSRLIYF
jgi:tetratricopeptide (TPR) repeat protein